MLIASLRLILLLGTGRALDEADSCLPMRSVGSKVASVSIYPHLIGRCTNQKCQYLALEIGAISDIIQQNFRECVLIFCE